MIGFFLLTGGGQMKILVVDDDVHILQLVNIYLTKEGYQVLLAENAKQALALLEGICLI